MDSMTLIVNGVTRFTVEQTLEGRPVANVLDFRIDTTGTTTDRNDAIQDQAEIIAREWAQTLLPLQVNQLTLDAVRWVDLDSADGGTGSITSGTGFTLPGTGGTAGDPLPNNTAALVRKTLESAGRGRRAGRMYWAGMAEANTLATDGNTISPAIVSAYNTAFATFLGDVNQNGSSVYQYDSAMCVVHVTSRDPDGKPLTGTSNDVGGLVLDPLLATQRRRLRR